jgi:hypothetical protein
MTDLVFVDASHDGQLERRIYDALLGFDGVSVWDDIHLPGAMQEFWDSVELPKLDITHLGHYTGTGIIFHNV